MLTLHIVVLVLLLLLCAWYLAFMLLPFMREATNEARRIAELLSQLPQEVGEGVACMPAVLTSPCLSLLSCVVERGCSASCLRRCFGSCLHPMPFDAACFPLVHQPPLTFSS